MTATLEFITGAIAKEDVSWGDSDSTFARELHTGGTGDVHNIDDNVIPAHTLGGVIADHLHTQDTDSGTTEASFEINQGGNSVTISSAGLSASRTFTVPDSADQELVGATDLLSTATGKGASKVGIEDSGGYFTGDEAETVLQEVGADIASLETSVFNRGLRLGFKLGYTSTNSITIGGGMWAHMGTTSQHVYLDSQTTFTLGPAGSNAQSTALGANQVHYIYIDDSAVVTHASAELSATEFINSTDAPAFSHSKVGWYGSGLTNTSANDRCIGAILTDNSSNIKSFSVFSNTFYRYAAPVAEYGTATAGVTYTALDISSSVPRFSTRARMRITSVTAGAVYYFDTASTSTTPEGYTNPTATSGVITIDAPTNSTQQSYWYSTIPANTTIDISGYYIDEL